MDIDTFKPSFLLQIEWQTLSADITQEITSFVFADNEEELDILELAVTDRKLRLAASTSHSRTKICFFAQISFRIFGHTVTLTSPRCAFLRIAISVRDCPMPPPMDSGSSPETMPLWYG